MVLLGPAQFHVAADNIHVPLVTFISVIAYLSFAVITTRFILHSVYRHPQAWPHAHLTTRTIPVSYNDLLGHEIIATDCLPSHCKLSSG